MNRYDTAEFAEFPETAYKPSFLYASDDLKLLQVNIPAGSELPAHKSPEAVLFVLSGEGTVEFPDSACPIFPGVAVVLPAGIDHGVTAVSNLRILVTVTAEKG